MSVGQPVMIIEDHDGADHTAGHHDHDAGEVGPNQWSLTRGRLSKNTFL
jgi:hypothetical protein